MKKKLAATCLAILLITDSTALYADDKDIPYPIRMPYRIVRGVTNIALGWTEIFLRPLGEPKTEGPFASLAIAVTNASIRGAVGWFDTTTFWGPDLRRNLRGPRNHLFHSISPPPLPRIN